MEPGETGRRPGRRLLKPWRDRLDPGDAGPARAPGRLRTAAASSTWASIARQMEAVIEAAGLQRYSVVGFSLGAAVAAVLASNRPDGLESLVLVAGPVDGINARVHLQFDLWRDLHRQDPQPFRAALVADRLQPRLRRAAADRGSLASSPPSRSPPASSAQSELNKRVELNDALLSRSRCRRWSSAAARTGSSRRPTFGMSPRSSLTVHTSSCNPATSRSSRSGGAGRSNRLLRSVPLTF